jgi:DNA primase
VKSVAVIPESITRSVYIKECTRILDVDEALLYAEVAKHRRSKMEKILGKSHYSARVEKKPTAPETPSLPSFIENIFCEEQEKEILYFLLKHGSEVFFEIPSDDELIPSTKVTVGQHIISEILNDDLEFNNLVYKKVFDEYQRLLEADQEFDNRHFINHPDFEISQVAVNLLTSQYKLSKIWKKNNAQPVDEIDFLHSAVPKSIMVYKSKITQMVIVDLQTELKAVDPKENPEGINQVLVRLKTIYELKTQLSKELDRIVL